MSDELVYVLWSNKHQMWWKHRANGYTPDVGSAGRFTEAEAVRYVVQSSHSGILSQVTCMVVAPEIWGGLDA